METSNIQAALMAAKQILGVVEDELPFDESLKSAIRDTIAGIESVVYGLWNVLRRIEGEGLPF